MSNKTKYRYIGAGAFVVGLPARDITEDDPPEVIALAEENIKNSTPGHACYEAVATPKKAAVKDGE